MKFSIKNPFSKSDQIRRKLRKLFCVVSASTLSKFSTFLAISSILDSLIFCEFCISRSSHPDAFYKSVLHLCWSLFLNNVTGLNPATLLKRDTCFSVNFAKFLRTPFFKDHLRWLLLHKDYGFLF